MKYKGTFFVTLLCLLSLAILTTIYLAWLFYPLEIKWLQLEAGVGLSHQTIQRNFQVLMDYLTNPFNWHLDMPHFPSSADGLYHFESVKKLFHLVQGLVLVGLPLTWYLTQRAIKKDTFNVLATFSKGFAFMATVPILIGLFAYFIGFSQFFTLFHHLLFPGDSTWLFHPDQDPVILILPELFFLHCFVLFFVCYEVLMASAFFLTRLKKFKN